VNSIGATSRGLSHTPFFISSRVSHCVLSGTIGNGQTSVPGVSLLSTVTPRARHKPVSHLLANKRLSTLHDQRIRQVARCLVADHNCLSVVNLEVQPCASLPISSWESRGIVMTTSNPNFFTRGQLGWRRIKRIRRAGQTECDSLTLQLYRSAIHAWFSSVTSMRRRPR
jgi:hypothetical protein